MTFLQFLRFLCFCDVVLRPQSRIFWIFAIYLMILYVLCFDFVIENCQNPTFYGIEACKPSFRRRNFHSGAHICISVAESRPPRTMTAVRGYGQLTKILAQTVHLINGFGRWTEIIILRWTSGWIFDDGPSTVHLMDRFGRRTIKDT